MTELKPGWRRVRFGEVVQLVSDRCDPSSAGIERFVGLEHIKPGDLRIRSWGYVADGTTFTSRFRSGKVLFGKRRAYQRKVAVADFEGVCSGDIYVLESADPGDLLPELLPFICQTDRFFEHAVGTSAGSLSPRTNWTNLASYEFALPPLEEQRHGLTIMQAFNRMGELLRKVHESATALRVALSQHLFAADTWPSRPLECAIATSAYGPRFSSELYDPTGNAFTIRTTDFTSNGGIDFSTAPAARLPAETVAQHRLRDGDFILSRSGEYAGMVRVFEEHKAGTADYIPAAFLIRFRLDRELLMPRFLLEYCESPHGKRSIAALAQGSAQPNISGSAFSRLLVPFPDLAEQEHACRVLSQARDAEWWASCRRAETARVARVASEQFFSGNYG